MKHLLEEALRALLAPGKGRCVVSFCKAHVAMAMLVASATTHQHLQMAVIAAIKATVVPLARALVLLVAQGARGWGGRICTDRREGRAWGADPASGPPPTR
jgi:hypothetical protein